MGKAISISSRKTKMVFAALIALAMTVAMSLSVFAAYPGTYETVLYKEGTYGTSNQEVSMGDPAILNSDVVYNASTNTTSVTVYVTPMQYKPLFITYTGYIDGMTLDGQDGTPQYLDADSHPDAFVYEFTGQLSGNAVFAAEFELSIVGWIHVNSGADLVISIL